MTKEQLQIYYDGLPLLISYIKDKGAYDVLDRWDRHCAKAHNTKVYEIDNANI